MQRTLMTSMILNRLVQTWATRYKTSLEPSRRCFTRDTHHDKSRTHHQSWMVIRNMREMRNEPLSLAQSSLKATVKEHQSLCKLLDQHESSVETVSLDQNFLEVISTTEIRGVEKADGEQNLSLVSRVRASDFPKLDIESEQSWEGAAESWMQLMGPKLSAVCPEVAGFWELTEREGPRKERNALAHPPMKRRRVQATAMLEPRFQRIERRFRPIVLDAVPEAMQKLAMNACLLGVAQLFC